MSNEYRFTFRFSDGKTIKARDLKEFVSRMRDTSFFESRLKLSEYMREVSARLLKVGFPVRSDSVEVFVEDLFASNIVSIEGNEE